MKHGKLLFIFFVLAIQFLISGCTKSIQVHPSYFVATDSGGKIEKKVAVVVPNTERNKKYTYNAWWAGWAANIEIGEALEEVSMKTTSSLYKDVYLVREKPNTGTGDLIFTPRVTQYRHDVPNLLPGLIPHTATITVHATLEDSNGKVLLDRDYNGKDSKSMTLDLEMWPVMEELAEKVFEQTFEIIANDLKDASKQAQ